LNCFNALQMSSYVFMLLRHSQVCIKLQAVINYRATLYVSAVFAVVRCPSVRPSICPYGTLVYCIHTAEDIIKLLSPPGSPIILVFCPRAPIPNSKGTPSAVAQNTRGGNFFCDFRLKSPFISKTLRDMIMVTMER